MVVLGLLATSTRRRGLAVWVHKTPPASPPLAPPPILGPHAAADRADLKLGFLSGMEEGSSATSASSWGRGSGAAKSPVPYRQKPLGYEPAVWCLCSRKAAMWIAWSDSNPGRRYLTCANRQTGGCGYWRWHDPEPSPFMRQLLVDLRDSVYELKAENAFLHNTILEGKKEGGHSAELRAKEEELESKDEELQALRAELKNKWNGKMWTVLVMLLLLGVVLSVQQ